MGQIYLYTIARGSNAWRWTSGISALSLFGNTYTPESGISHGDCGNGMQELDITVGGQNVYVVAHKAYCPAGKTSVTIHRIDDADVATLRVVYKGWVVSVSWNEDNTVGKLHLQPIIAGEDVMIPWEDCSPQCRHFLYDENCGLAADDHKYEAAVTAVSGRTLTVSGLSGLGASWAKYGYVRYGDDEYRQIVGQTGDTLELMYAFEVDLTGETVAVFEGCDRSVTRCVELQGDASNFGGWPFVPTINIFAQGVK